MISIDPPAIDDSEGRSGISVYCSSEMSREIRQGEIITDIVQYSYDFEMEKAFGRPIPISLVVSQDCDLLQDFERTAQDQPSGLNGILLYEGTLLSVARATLGNAEMARRVKKNLEDRYHYLESIPPEIDLMGLGIGPIVVDFKKFFTISPRDLYRQLKIDNGPKRRCRLDMPYREHLQSRVSFYLARVALPQPHKMEP